MWYAGEVVIGNSILAGNTAGNDGYDCRGNFSSTGYNYIGNPSGCNFITTSGDVGGDPYLGPLQDNGGLTLTHEPQKLSLAIDGGSPATPGSGSGACEATDQIGTSRPIDGDNDATSRCDIGALEFDPGPLPPPGTPYYVSTTGDDSNDCISPATAWRTRRACNCSAPSCLA